MEEGKDNKGRFTSGNSGRPKGAKGKKTEAWDKLGEYIVGEGAETFMSNVITMMQGDDPRQKIEAMKMYQGTVEYFKPKLAKTEVAQETKLQHDISNITDVDLERLEQITYQLTNPKSDKG